MAASAMLDSTERKPMTIRRVPIARIKVPPGRVSSHEVEGLASSIAEIGLLEPIGVDAKLTLVYGRRRLEACRSLEWTEIPAIEVSLEGLRAGLATVDENLMRGELSALERAQLVAERKRIYEALHPDVRGGVAGGIASGKSRAKEPTEQRPPVAAVQATPAFTADTAEATGRSERSVRRDAQIGERLNPEAAALLVDTAVADSPTKLLEIAKQAPAEQVKTAKAIKAGKRKTKPVPKDDAELFKSAWLGIKRSVVALGNHLREASMTDAVTGEYDKARIDAVLRGAWEAKAERAFSVSTSSFGAIGKALIAIGLTGSVLGREFVAEGGKRQAAHTKKQTKKAKRRS